MSLVDAVRSAVGGADDDREVAPLDADEVFALLANARRREVVRCLDDADGPVTKSALTTRVAAADCGVDPDGLDRQERHRVYISLHQTHLPRLESAGLVEWDRDPYPQLVAPTPALSAVRRVVDEVDALTGGDDG